MFSFGPSGTTRGIKVLVITTLVVFLLQLLPYSGDFLLNYGSLIPFSTFDQWQIWRLFSYMFLHATSSPFHILFNMLMLWMFGVEIENLWGTRRFVIFYLLCGMGSGLFSLFSLFNDYMRFTPVIGASGAVLGIMTVYAYYFPQRQVYLFFVLPVNIRIILIGYALISLFGSLAPQGIISHLTHLGGIVVALGYLKLYPYISGWFQERHEKQNEVRLRRRAEAEAERKRFFEQMVDPVLDKIAKEGMGALTDQEKKILKKAATFDSARLKKGKIVPLDPFR